MTNAELLAKIKAEIERLKDENRKIKCQANERYCSGYDDAFYDLVPFLSTIESEKPMNPEGLKEEIDKYREEHLFDMPAFQQVARHFAEWGAEHRGNSETPKEDKLRYCIEYINPRFPLLDNGGLNVRHLRVPDEHWAEMAITLILSFGGKIYALYRGNVKDGKLADWPTPMIVESEDWFTDEWLHELIDCGHNCL